MTDVRYRRHPFRLPRYRFPRSGGVAISATMLGLLLVSFVGPAASAQPPTASAQPPAASAQPPAAGTVTELSEHLLVYHGPINVGIVRNGETALLIDCADEGLDAALAKLGISRVERIVFTHHHRDQTLGAASLAKQGAKIGVFEGQRDYFVDPAGYWNDEHNLWRLYSTFRPHPLMLTEPLPVDETFADGQETTFGPAKIRVLATPGHTEHAVSYLVEVDGRRVVFCGDAIYDEGRVWDIYSLQKGFGKGGRQIGGYHGFMGDRWRLVESLTRIKDQRPDRLVPSHGHVMDDPARAIDTLAERFETCYENYVGISALRHYFPELFTDYAGRPGQMPIRPGIAPPDCLRHFNTTWMLVSESGAGFAMDIGAPNVVDQIGRMIDAGDISSVEGLWVTHYHYDHTAGIPAFQRRFDCPCFAERHLAQVLTNPARWRLPCLMKEPIRVDRPMEDGQSWQWHEFKMTAYNFPGQTLYHDALLVEKDQLRMLFVGDSHTMAGIDDYCAYNRNWLGRGVGFQYCLSLIEKLRPTHIFNCHVKDAFTFTPEEIRFMRDNLDRREELFGSLVPWDHANYGMDATWVRCDPYLQKVKPGDTVRLEVVVTNHSAQTQQSASRAVLPTAFRSVGASPGLFTPWVKAEVPAKAQQRLPMSFEIPSDATPGRFVVPVDVKHGPWNLPRFTETIIDVVGPESK